MKVSVRIDCTPTEARRVIGAPELLPLYEILTQALEGCLVCQLARLDPLSLAPERAAAAAEPAYRSSSRRLLDLRS